MYVHIIERKKERKEKKEKRREKERNIKFYIALTFFNTVSKTDAKCLYELFKVKDREKPTSS